MIYTIVDEAYDVTVARTQLSLSLFLDGYFHEDGRKMTINSIRKFFSENKIANLYAYVEDETGEHKWSRDWHYRVERHP